MFHVLDTDYELEYCESYTGAVFFFVQSRCADEISIDDNT